MLAFVGLLLTLPAAADEPKEKRELLANHETLAVFDGLKYRLCMGRTALCPKRCGDSGEFATFAIKKYLKYEKLGQYGDPKQEDFLVQVSDYDKKPKGDPKILETVKGLKKGDYVLLSWHHDYVTKEGSSFPERPIVKLESISKEKAQELLSAPAAPAAKEDSETQGKTTRKRKARLARTEVSMKGWELYIWQQGGNTYFSLLEGTNRLKADDEITKAVVKGIDAIKAKLAELKAGEEVFIVGRKLTEPPPKDQATPVVEYGRKIGLKVQGQSQ